MRHMGKTLPGLFALGDVELDGNVLHGITGSIVNRRDVRFFVEDLPVLAPVGELSRPYLATG